LEKMKVGETQASGPRRGRRTLIKRRRALGAAVALAIAASPVAAFATDNVWTGAVDNNYNNPGNWSLGRVPVKPNGEAPPADGYDDAILNTSTGNVPTITQDFAASPRDIVVGVGPGANGVVNHSAGTATTGDGNWLFIGRNGGTGTYNLTGSGSINARGRIYVAGHDGAAATGTFNINTTGSVSAANDLNIGAAGGTGTVNLTAGTVNVGGWLSIGRDEPNATTNGTGNFNQTGGTLNNAGNTVVALPGTRGNLTMTGGTNNTNGELWVGQGAGAVGVATVNAGTVTVNNWIAVGREGSTGTLNVGGTGTVNKVGGGHITIGTGTGTGAGGNGTVNVSGNGTLTTNGDFILGENNATAVGVVNQTGGLVKVAGTLDVQRSGIGTYNLSGGTLSVDGNIDSAAGTFSFTGGKITRSNGGTTTVNGPLTTGGTAALIDVGSGKTFDVNGALDVTRGVGFDLTGREVPAAAGTGSFGLGTVDSILGTFGPGSTNVTGLSNPSGATFISEAQGEGHTYPASQSVFWIQEAGGAVSLQYSVVPEPGSVMLLSLSGLGVLARRRRKA
jgi:hypothetical protein